MKHDQLISNQLDCILVCGKIKFAKVNVDTQQEIAGKYGVMSIPVIKFFCDGKEVGELVGYVPKDKLKNEMDRVLQTHMQCLAQISSKK